MQEPSKCSHLLSNVTLLYSCSGMPVDLEMYHDHVTVWVITQVGRCLEETDSK